MRLGKYQLLRKLATGGMAEVFLAKTDGPMGFEKLLVIKRILPHLAEDPQFIEMFLGEAKLAAQLNHPNLVQLFDFGQAEGSYFIAMEYIDGPTLRLLLSRARDLQTPISHALAARIVSSAAEGLAYAHDFRDQVTDEPLHLVHRDVSPDNILIGRSGAVKLVDFGIAKARGQSHHTQAGTVKGKVAYMAPEQLRGEPLDRRVDLYALGVVLYELCTGRMPFEASSDASMVRAVLYDAIVPAVRRVPTLPRPLQVILERLLARNREARYPDCRTLHADLEVFIQSTGEATNGFALSRLVSTLVPPAPPTTPTPVRGIEIPPRVTASAFAPTSSSPILLSEPVGGAVPAPPLEVLELDRTVRSEPRRPAPPVASLEVRHAEHAPRAPAPGAFVFPTALGQERDSVAPVELGLARADRRTRTGRTAVVRPGGGGFLRTVGLLALFAVLAAVGAYLGLAAAHRTDLLARVGLPVPGVLGGDGNVPAPAGSSERPASTAGGAPTGPAQPPVPAVAARPEGTGPAPSPSGPGAPSGSSAAAPTGSTASSAPRQPPASPAPVPPAAPATSGSSSPGTSEPSAPPTGAAEPGVAEPATGAPTSGAPGGAAIVSAAAAGTTLPERASTGSTEPTEGAPAGARASGSSEPSAASKGATGALDPARRARRETDREKLLGAFADVEAAKESTVRLESTPKLRVRLGGKLVGTTPVTLTVPASDAPVELEFFDTGLGLSKTEQLVLKPGDNGTHSLVFPRGTLELKVQDGVAVSIDGKPAGTAPLAPVSLYEGRHVVQLSKGDLKERRTLDIRGDQTEVLEYSFPEDE
jgi:serine/threonine-protein kinase